MKCRRCEGMMVEERIFTREGGILMTRCLYCGELIDQVVMTNRHRTEASLAAPEEEMSVFPSSFWKRRNAHAA